VVENSDMVCGLEGSVDEDDNENEWEWGLDIYIYK
jgi:hypothetical protein